MHPNKIELRKKRDFGDKINATFEFLRLNFKHLFKVIFFIAVPVVLVCAIALSLISSVFGGLGNEELTDPTQMFGQTLALFGPATIVMFLVLSFGFIITLSVTYEFMLVYSEGGDVTDIGLLWKRSVKNIVNLILSTLGNSVLVFIVMLVFAGVIGAFSVLGAGGIIAGLFFGIFALFGIVVLFSPLALIYPVQVLEKASYGKALSRVFQLVKGREWLSTAGLIFIMIIISYFIQLIFTLPFQIINFTTTMHNVSEGNPPSFGMTYVLTYVFSILGSFLTTPIFWVAMAFQYFNLVEKRELVGLISEIDKIGERNDNEEEGEEWY